MDPLSPATTGPRLDDRSALSRYGPVVLYLLGAAILWRDFNFIYYKDELSYLSAAARYARGDLGGVNSYWAPLLSWLLAPLLAVGVSAATASDIVSVLCGLLALLGGRALIRSLGTTGWLASLLEYTLAVVCVYCAMRFISADLLLAGILSWYFGIVFRRDYATRPAAGYLSGMLGGLAYYAKTYAFFFFAAHFVLANVGHYLWADAAARASVRRQLVRGLLVFGAMVGVWVAAMFAKYHVVTLGLTGRYNYAIVGPEAADRPILAIGFDGEPRPGNTSIWEDPADFYKIPSALQCCLKDWSPLASAQTLKHQLRLIKTNVAITLEQYQLFSSLSYAVILICVLLCVPRRADAKTHLPIVLALITLVLYPAGYVLVYSEERYLWPMLILLLALTGYVLQIAFATSFFSQIRRQQLLAAFVVLSFIKVPLSKLLPARDFGRNTSRFVEELRGVDLRGKRVASNTDYGASDIVAYYHSASYLGQKRPGITPAQTAAELKAARVDYYLVWGEPPADSIPPGLSRAAEVKVAPANGGQTALTVFRVN